MAKRFCDQCKGSLPGKKKHGWTDRVGKSLLCSACAFPESRKWRAKTVKLAFGVVPTQLQSPPETRSYGSGGASEGWPAGRVYEPGRVSAAAQPEAF